MYRFFRVLYPIKRIQGIIKRNIFRAENWELNIPVSPEEKRINVVYTFFTPQLHNTATLYMWCLALMVSSLFLRFLCSSWCPFFINALIISGIWLAGFVCFIRQEMLFLLFNENGSLGLLLLLLFLYTEKGIDCCSCARTRGKCYGVIFLNKGSG